MEKMDDNFNYPHSEMRRTPVKKEYQTPKLDYFGSVVQLTNSFTSSCRADDGTCTSDPGNNMGPKP